jgi:hypothetical protein
MKTQNLTHQKKRSSKELREERAFQRFGTRKPNCRECSETNPIALTGTYPNILCYECQAKGQGRSTIELHHFAGRHNNKTVLAVPGNDHRILSDMQKEWPENMLRNPKKSPLIKAAASIQGFLDLLKITIERILGWIPEFLEKLDLFLTQRFGEAWWESEEFQGAI